MYDAKRKFAKVLERVKHPAGRNAEARSCRFLPALKLGSPSRWAICYRKSGNGMTRAFHFSKPNFIGTAHPYQPRERTALKPQNTKPSALPYDKIDSYLRCSKSRLNLVDALTAKAKASSYFRSLFDNRQYRD